VSDVVERVAIDLTLCDGCGICIDSCPTDVLRVDPATQRAAAVYPQDCCGCFFCQDDCPQHAIVVGDADANPRQISIYDVLGIA
jgi:adenylylsulfate reductase, subunit B